VYRLGAENVTALAGLDLAIEHGAMVGIVGRSGSGKSTLLNILGGLDTPTSGDVEVDGVRLTGAGQDTLALYRLRKVGFVFQSFNLIASLSAQQNVELPLVFGGVPAGERRDRAEALLDNVGLAARRRHRPAQLSGGEQQRVAIARALVNRPAILLADEPTGNLDTATAAGVMDLLAKTHAGGQTILLVTHDRALADASCRRVIELSDGKVVADREAVRA
jgi:putative ABC transport system ATP-binding protein